MSGPAAAGAIDRERAALVRRRLLRASSAARVHVAASVALGVAAAALVIAQAALLAEVVTGVFLGGASLGDVQGSLVALVAVAAARGVVAFGFESSGRIGASRAMAELRERLVRHLLVERPGGLARERRGELAAAAVQGVDSLEAWFARYLPQAVLAVLVPVAILAWVVPLDWPAAAILLVTVPLIPLFMVLIGRMAERSTRARWKALASLSGHLLDVVAGLETLRAFNRAEAQADTVATASDAYRRETMATLRVAFLSALVLELLAMLGTALVAATIGVQLIAGELGLEAGLTVLILAPELYLPVRNLGAQFHASADGLAAAERIFEALDEPATVVAPDRPAPAPDPSQAVLRLEDVRFEHPGRAGAVLDGAELALRPGETVALLGPSGAGKSTLASLLLRLVEPCGGRISCGGVDLRAVDPADWRRRVGWIPQRPTLFNGTVADNVRLAAPEASDDEVEAALVKAEAWELVGSLPDGPATVVGDGGRRLSAGQAQRIALARAFLRDAPLLILDEPTAHLDSATAALVEEAIARLARGRTALWIAHRPGAALRADRVVALEHGRLREIHGARKAVPSPARREAPR